MKKGIIAFLVVVLSVFALSATPQIGVSVSQGKTATELGLDVVASGVEFSLGGGLPLIRKVYSPGPNVYLDGTAKSSKMDFEEIMKTPVVSASLLFSFINERLNNGMIVDWSAGISTDAAVRLSRNLENIKVVGSYGPTIKLSMILKDNFKLSYQATIPADNIIGLMRNKNLDNYRFWTLGPMDRNSDEYIELNNLAWYESMRLTFTYFF